MIGLRDIIGYLSREDAEAILAGFDAFRENPDWHKIMLQTKAGDVYHACVAVLKKLDE